MLSLGLERGRVECDRVDWLMKEGGSEEEFLKTSKQPSHSFEHRTKVREETLGPKKHTHFLLQCLRNRAAPLISLVPSDPPRQHQTFSPLDLSKILPLFSSLSLQTLQNSLLVALPPLLFTCSGRPLTLPSSPWRSPSLPLPPPMGQSLATVPPPPSPPPSPRRCPPSFPTFPEALSRRGCEGRGDGREAEKGEDSERERCGGVSDDHPDDHRSHYHSSSSSSSSSSSHPPSPRSYSSSSSHPSSYPSSHHSSSPSSSHPPSHHSSSSSSPSVPPPSSSQSFPQPPSIATARSNSPLLLGPLHPPSSAPLPPLHHPTLDVTSLQQPGYWLRDDAIQTFLDLLQSTTRTDLVLPTHFYTKLMSLENHPEGVYDYDAVSRWTGKSRLAKMCGEETVFGGAVTRVLVPINIEKHWYLLTADLVTGSIVSWDSARDQSSSLDPSLSLAPLSAVSRWLTDEATSKTPTVPLPLWSLTPSPLSAPQRDPSRPGDCGMFLLLAADFLVAYGGEVIGRDVYGSGGMEERRRRLAEVLAACG